VNAGRFLRHFEPLSCLFVLALAAARPAYGQQPERIPIDGVAAIVGSEIVLKSDVELGLNAILMQQGRDPSGLTTEERASLRDQVLENLINDALIVAKAQRDSVTVTRGEVDRQIDLRIEGIRGNFGGEEGFQQALAAEGMTLPEFRRRLYPQEENRLLMQKLWQEAGVIRLTTVSRREGADWLRAHRDDLMVLRHIRLDPPEVDDPETMARRRAQDLRHRIVEGGEDFAALARSHSGDPGSAPEGGDLGTVPKGTFVTAFEDAAWNLPVGEVSEPVQTQFGWHLIQVLERTADRVHVRHILLRPATSSAALQALADTIAVIRSDLEQGRPFLDLVARWSAAPDAVARQGLFGLVLLPVSAQTSGLPPDWVSALQGLAVGAWTGPLELTGEEGMTSVYFLQRLALGEETIDLILRREFRQVEAQVQNERRQQAIEDWFQELRRQTYVEIKKGTDGR
jgi:peptidyl-prolyl cis-trans isomerase SurA